ncbi:MAG: ATP-binding protein [Paludibacteraceae bacterium]|nr:ATP-binding protein [Paludibacteraceae bacterium]
MKRDAIKYLYEWKSRTNHKPMIVRGARQVGKTWLMRTFAEEAYNKYVYVNFEDNELIRNMFERDFDIERIIVALQVATGVMIDKDTLIIFDEIQEAPKGLTALKYFYEKAPEYSILAAGSLLGISMHEAVSFPVGKVEFMDLYPLSFREFLNALGQTQLVDVLEKEDWELMSLFHNKLVEYLKIYYFVGGMPGVVMEYLETKDFNRVRVLQQEILNAYDNDFSKHAPNKEVPRLRMVWRSLLAQLAKENKKFIYGMLKEGARAKEFEMALEWLQDAGLLYKVNRTKAGKMPLSAYEDFSAFKLFILDVGLLAAMGKLTSQIILDGDAIFEEFKGALTEQYVFQQLKTYEDIDIYYWSADNSSGEIDFIVQKEGVITPIEVKSTENLQSKSLSAFIKRNPELKGLRFSMSEYKEQDWMKNKPLYSI